MGSGLLSPIGTLFRKSHLSSIVSRSTKMAACKIWVTELLKGRRGEGGGSQWRKESGFPKWRHCPTWLLSLTLHEWMTSLWLSLVSRPKGCHQSHALKETLTHSRRRWLWPYLHHQSILVIACHVLIHMFKKKDSIDSYWIASLGGRWPSVPILALCPASGTLGKIAKPLALSGAS